MYFLQFQGWTSFLKCILRISLHPQNVFQEVQTSESIFNSAANIFLECSRNIWSIKREGGGVLKRRKTWNSSTLFTRFWRFWRRPDWDIPPILGADETRYIICGRTPPSEQLAEHYSADCSLTRCTIARLFKSAITHVHSQAAPNCR